MRHQREQCIVLQESIIPRSQKSSRCFGINGSVFDCLHRGQHVVGRTSRCELMYFVIEWLSFVRVFFCFCVSDLRIKTVRNPSVLTDGFLFACIENNMTCFFCLTIWLYDNTMHCELDHEFMN